MNTVFCTVPRLFYKIAKTNLKAKFSITVTLVGLNAKARFAIEYEAVFYDFAKLRPDPETEFLFLKIIDRLKLGQQIKPCQIKDLQAGVLRVFHMGRHGKRLHPEPAPPEPGGVIPSIVLDRVEVVKIHHRKEAKAQRR